jgi:hypothetical protein
MQNVVTRVQVSRFYRRGRRVHARAAPGQQNLAVIVAAHRVSMVSAYGFSSYNVLRTRVNLRPCGPDFIAFPLSNFEKLQLIKPFSIFLDNAKQ